MGTCVCFDWMHVEHMQIGSYCCNKIALTNLRGIAVNSYFFNEKWIMNNEFKTFILNSF